MPETLNSPVNFPTMDSYQTWVRQNWVHAHGSNAAQFHTRAKFEEEIDELREAIHIGNTLDISLELGDVLWTATATADNAGINIADSLQYTYPHIFTTPDIPTDYLDLVVANHAHDFSIKDIDELLVDLKFQLGKNAKQWFFLKPFLDDTGTRRFADVLIEEKAHQAKTGLADTLLLISYIAQHDLSKSTEEIMLTNLGKLSGRLAGGKPVTSQPRQ